jgi:norsolorinic acid ketoreductase
MGVAGARAIHAEDYMIGVDVACDGMIRVMNSSTKEKHGGKMVGFDGEILGW